MNKANGPFHTLLCVGSFFPPSPIPTSPEQWQTLELHRFLSGEESVPIPTYAVVRNSDRSNEWLRAIRKRLRQLAQSQAAKSAVVSGRTDEQNDKDAGERAAEKEEGKPGGEDQGTVEDDKAPAVENTGDGEGANESGDANVPAGVEGEQLDDGSAAEAAAGGVTAASTVASDAAGTGDDDSAAAPAAPAAPDTNGGATADTKSDHGVNEEEEEEEPEASLPQRLVICPNFVLLHGAGLADVCGKQHYCISCLEKPEHK